MRSALRSGARALRSSAGLRTIRVGGVPEHFNTPWHLANAAGKYAEVGIALEWVEFPGGTGAMASALRNDQIDVAIGLTEGIVADILKGSPARIIGALAHLLRGALTPRSRARCTARAAQASTYRRRSRGACTCRPPPTCAWLSVASPAP